MARRVSRPSVTRGALLSIGFALAGVAVLGEGACDRDWGFLAHPDASSNPDGGIDAPLDAFSALKDDAWSGGDAWSGSDASDVADAPDSAGDAGPGWSPDKRVNDSTWLVSNGVPAMASNAGESIVLSTDPTSLQLVEDKYADGGFTGRTFVGDQTSDSTPAVTAYRSSFVLVHREASGTGDLRWATRALGTSWGSDDYVEWTADGHLFVNLIASDVPALASLNDLVVMVFPVTGGALHYATWDGNQWSADQLIAGTSSWGRPAIAVYQDAVHLTFRHSGADHEVEHRTFDGATWSGGTLVPNVLSQYDTSLAVHGGLLYLVHMTNAGYNMAWETFDGSTWSATRGVAGELTDWPPHVADMNGQLLLLHTSDNAYTEIWYSLWQD